MKNNIFLVLLSVILLTGCVVSPSEKENMELNLRRHLSTILRNGYSIDAQYLEVKINNISKRKNSFKAYYVANFKATFYDPKESKDVVLSGKAGFNKLGEIGVVNKKWTFEITDVLENGQPKEPICSIYGIPNVTERDKTLSQILNEARNLGLKSPGIGGDNYLVYYEYPSNIKSSPKWVAKQIYEMFNDCPDLKGVRILSAADNSVIGEYSK